MVVAEIVEDSSWNQYGRSLLHLLDVGFGMSTLWVCRTVSTVIQRNKDAVPVLS